MPLGLTDEHAALSEAVARLATKHAPRHATRDALTKLSAGDRCESWPSLHEHGFLGMHLPEEVGGGGADAVAVAVAAEAAGRELVPGPFLPTVMAGLLLTDAGGAALATFGPRLVDGASAACAVEPAGLTAEVTSNGLVVEGCAPAVLGAPGADLLVLAARTPADDVWFVVDPRQARGVTVDAAPPVDLTRSIGTVTATGLTVPAEQVLTGLGTDRARSLAVVPLAAEAAGVARWCFDTALDYVQVREQFGRAVGSFQAVKHKTAALFVRAEVLAAAAWDAARAVGDEHDQLVLAAAEAAVVCLPGARDAALEAITLLGGIGYTWEHDITLYWRRALAAAQLVGGPSPWAHRLGGLVRHSTRRFGVDVRDDDFRTTVAADLARAAALDEPQRRHLLADLGYVSPQYPPPYGVAATPAQQIVISQEFRRVGMAQPSTIIGEFALPTILAHGTQEQKDRFVVATLRGEVVWCQLFSEPEAGSDLASLRTGAEKVPGGWRLNGQKVWTSKAHEAHWGICLARTDPQAPKHKGISYFLVDMSSEGVDVRPLRQATGLAEFNEVFLSDVFVPDDCLVGQPGDGWRIATTTLANERLMIASGAGTTSPFSRLLEQVTDSEHLADDALVRIGTLAAESFALDALGLRALLQRLEGLNPGATSSVLKLASTEHRRAVATAGLDLAGAAASTLAPGGDGVIDPYLSLPAVLIGGGTREIQLNVVAERILGLPRG